MEGSNRTFVEVAPSVYIGDLLSKPATRDILDEIDRGDGREPAEVLISRRNADGVREIVSVLDTDRRSARRFLLDERGLAAKPRTSSAVGDIQRHVLSFAGEEFGIDFVECGDHQILVYAKGGQFTPHKDTSPERPQRALTVIVYLNDDFQGGETDFPNLGYRCRPESGRVLIFLSNELHAGLPVLEGEKKILVFWIHLPKVSG